MDKRVVIASLVSGIVGAAAGGAITYLTVKKTFADRAQRDIDDVKASYTERFEGKKIVNFYGNMPGPAQPGDPEVVRTPIGTISTEKIQQARKFAQELGYATPVPGSPSGENEPEIEEDRSVSIYDRAAPSDEDLGEEVESPLLIGYDRNALKAVHKPYLISHEEFHNTETEWDKSSITYYEDDDVLTDEADRPVDSIEYLIGEKHLDFFGLRSGDKNQVYIRNPQISTDFEVTRNVGSFTEIVLGIPKDSDKVGTRRMRSGDDD